MGGVRQGAALLPHSLDLERCLLNAALDWGIRIPRLEPRDFFRREHAIVAQAIYALQDAGLVAQYHLVREALRERQELDAVGEVYLSEIVNGAGGLRSEVGAVSVAERLKALTARRELARLILKYAENPAAIDIERFTNDLRMLEIVGKVGIKASFRTAKEVAAAAEHVNWIVRGYLAAGGITELTGKAKVAGKTTLIAFIVACILDGDLCLGSMAAKGPVVWLTEQTHATFREVLRRAGLLDREDLSILSYWDVKGQPWPAIVEMADREADRIGAKVLIVDTLAQFAALEGDKENNAGDALEALAPLQHAAHRGKAILISRHARKGGGDVGEDGRGSSAFTGGTDIVLSLRRPEGNHKPTIRMLKSESRYDETPKALLIEKVSLFCSGAGTPGIEVRTESFQVLGDTEAAATDQAKAGLERHLPATAAEAIPMVRLEQLTGADRAAIQRALKSLPGVEKTGKGRKGDPHRYFRPVCVSAQTSNPEGSNEQNREHRAHALASEEVLCPADGMRHLTQKARFYPGEIGQCFQGISRDR